MPNLNHRFSSGRMNKDLDERLVPNGEYRDALNIEVTTSEGSDMGTVQTVMGNLNKSLETIDPANGGEFHCVGSVVNETHDKIYWMLSGVRSDIIAEYDYKTQTTTPVVVDLFASGTFPGNESGRVLNFDKGFTITGINIIEDMLFWTDNFSEPKRIHIDRCKLGTPDFTSQTQLYVRDISTSNASIDYFAKGDLKHEHITVIKKAPPAPPVLELRNKTRTEQSDIDSSWLANSLVTISGNIDTSNEDTPENPWVDDQGDFLSNEIQIVFNSTGLAGFPDFIAGDTIIIYAGVDSPEDTNVYIRAQIVSLDVDYATNGSCLIRVLSGSTGIYSHTFNWYIELEQGEPLFQFKFPRFALRYKYEDGEYSAFSPFSQVAFLPREFDYFPKEGYNLGMVNNLRFLAIKDFVHGRQIPDDVISIDILYKESNSPNVYTVKTIKRLENDWLPGFEPWSSNVMSPDDAVANWNEWNAMGPKNSPIGEFGANGISSDQMTRGWTRITSEMIHSVLPSNQLLRPWDNVPRVALAQEVVGNRLVYGNYLQNYNMFNRFATTTEALKYYSEFNHGELDPQSQISVDISVGVDSYSVGENLPEQSDPFAAQRNLFGPAKSIKTLRTYQLGVVYIDEFGRETPVFSNSTTDKSSLYVEKNIANKKNKLQAQLFNTHPEWAKSFKFFVKETSNEYYNLAMDRWYDAEDGNIWLSFPSAERNKVDEETFLILKKEHNSDEFVETKARYKIIAIENQAPLFVKTTRVPQPTFNDSKATSPFDIGSAASGFPEINESSVELDDAQVQAVGWTEIMGLPLPAGTTGSSPTPKQPTREFDIRFRGSGNVASAWYKLKSVVHNGASDYRFTVSGSFNADVNVLSPDGTAATYAGGGLVELRRRVIENKPEFDGRFFVKIKKDPQLEKTIIKPASASTNWQVNIGQQVQYINPSSQWAINNSNGGWYNEWNGHGSSSYQKISYYANKKVLGYEVTGTWSTSHEGGGDDAKGQKYWDFAGDTDNASSESSGWFIDRVEGFRRFKTSQHLYNVKNSDPWVTNDQHGSASFDSNYNDDNWHDRYKYYNWHHEVNSGASHMDNAENDFNMPQVMGTATGHTAHTNDYLGLGNFNPISGVLGPAFNDAGSGHCDDFNPTLASIPDIRKTVLRSGWNGFLDGGGVGGVEAKAIDGGQILPSLGIDGHPLAGGAINDEVGEQQGLVGYQGSNIITLSYSGVGVDDEDGYRDAPGTGGTVADLRLHFDLVASSAVAKHTEDTLFINTLTTPGTVWRWAEDPGGVLYETVNADISELSVWGITNEEWNRNRIDAIDSKPGVGLYNYCLMSDWCDYHSIDGPPGTTNYKRGAFVSAGINSISYVDGRDYTNGSSPTGSFNYWQFPGEHYGPTGGAQFHSNSLTADTYLESTNNAGGWFHSSYTYGTISYGGSPSPHGYFPMYVKDWWKAKNKRRRYMFVAKTYDSAGTGQLSLGETGPHYYLPTNDPSLTPHFDANGIVAGEPTSAIASVPGTPAPGIRPDGVYSGYILSGNTVPVGPKKTGGNIPGSVTWQILSPYIEIDGEKYSSTNPAIWETEPKENVDLDIYHEVGQIYPVELNQSTGEQFVGPVHPRALAYLNSAITCWRPPTGPNVQLSTNNTLVGIFEGAQDVRVESIEDNVLKICDVNGNSLNAFATNPFFPQIGDILTFHRSNGGSTSTAILDINETSGEIVLDRNVHNYKVTLPWHNCYSFGNGVESDRIRDDYNQVTIDNGPKASATLEEPYEEERRGSGFIWSGIYNSMSGVNNLNQFIQAEKITKDLNPSYGSIQKLHTRNTNLLTFCEDKVFKVLANKDALYNADGNSNLTATNLVLGATTPFVGEFGISKNPESFATESYRAYFTDKTRGKVLRLSQDGITTISEAGMSDYFADNLKHANKLIGSFDEKKGEYNLTLDHNDYPTPMPPEIIDNFWVEIEGEHCGCGGNYYRPTGNIVTSTSNTVVPGMIIQGPGLAVNTIVTGVTVNFSQLIIAVNPPPQFADVTPLLGPSDAGSYGGWSTQVAIGYPSTTSSTYTNTSGNEDTTISFSERAKGWSSFKSFIPEGGVSLNNTYYTFKEGHLHQHHVESEPRNTFYGDHTESSIQVLFNEGPETVKSFNGLSYEGTHSRITPDTQFSGEWWDNELHRGWYVSEMYTNLQEGDVHEFKNKEGKWFSEIKGVTTEWLDDGTGGNIDPREFSYQGIDDASAVTITSGGYTSWDCIQHVSYDQPDPACTTDLAKSLDGNLYVHYDLAAATAAGDPSLQNPSWVNYYMQNAIGTGYMNYFIMGGVGFGSNEFYTDHSSYISMATPTVQNPCYVNGVDNSQGHYMKNDGWSNASGNAPWINAQLQYIHSISQGLNLYHSNGMDIYQAMDNKLLVWELEYDANGNSIFPANVESLKDIAIANNTPYADGPEPCICLPSTSGGTSHDCVEVQGLYGQYATESMCLGDPNSACGTPIESWECIDNGINATCMDPGDGTGSYTTYCDCVSNSLCCDEGVSYMFDCQNITQPSMIVYGCMDDGNTTDPFITRDRPAGWSGPASNYYINANTPNCSCVYSTAPPNQTYDCSGPNGISYTDPITNVTTNYAPYTCYDPNTGSGQYTATSASANGYANALAECQADCAQVLCNPANYFTHNIATTPASDNPTTACAPSNNNGDISVALSNMVHDCLVELKDISGNVISSQNVSAPSGSIMFGTLTADTYTVEIHDVVDNCGVIEQHEIICLPSQCDTNNWDIRDGMLNYPMETEIGCSTVGTPGGSNYSVLGADTINIYAPGNPSATSASVEIYHYPLGPNSLMVGFSGVGSIGWGTSGQAGDSAVSFASFYPNAAQVAANPSGPYQFLWRITDNTGCTIDLIREVDCVYNPPCQTSNWSVNSSFTQTFVGTNSTCDVVTQPGEIQVQAVNLGNSVATSYTVTVETEVSAMPSATPTVIYPTSTFIPTGTTTTISNIYPDANQIAIGAPYVFNIKLEDDQGCTYTEEITIPCVYSTPVDRYDCNNSGSNIVANNQTIVPGQCYNSGPSGTYTTLLDCYNNSPCQPGGCMDPQATNYDPNATWDDGSCIYPEVHYRCNDGNVCVQTTQAVNNINIFSDLFTCQQNCGNIVIPTPCDSLSNIVTGYDNNFAGIINNQYTFNTAGTDAVGGSNWPVWTDWENSHVDAIQSIAGGAVAGEWLGWKASPGTGSTFYAFWNDPGLNATGEMTLWGPPQNGPKYHTTGIFMALPPGQISGGQQFKVHVFTGSDFHRGTEDFLTPTTSYSATNNANSTTGALFVLAGDAGVTIGGMPHSGMTGYPIFFNDPTGALQPNTQYTTDDGVAFPVSQYGDPQYLTVGLRSTCSQHLSIVGVCIELL